MKSNSNKVVLITGGSRGLGKSMALQLAGRGFDVIITYNANENAANEIVKELKTLGSKAAALHLDVTQTGSYDQFAEQIEAQLIRDFGTDRIYALVNNAGTAAYTSIADTSEEVFDSMVTIHLKAPYFITQKLLPVISDGGAIVNISSGLARFSLPNYAPYAIMKAAIESLSRYQAQELGSRGIRVNTVAPGAIATDFGGGAVRDNSELNAMIAGSTALGRVGLPDDIGTVVAFLCSDDAKWVNAQRIEVSGGVHI